MTKMHIRRTPKHLTQIKVYVAMQHYPEPSAGSQQHAWRENVTCNLEKDKEGESQMETKKNTIINHQQKLKCHKVNV